MKKRKWIVFFTIALFIPIMSVSATTKVQCGGIAEIPDKIPQITSLIVTFIEILVPIILVIMGTIDLVKGVAAQKEDDIKKGQQMFIKRLIVGAIIFFVIVLSKFLISLVADSNEEKDNIVSCIDCFISGDCKISYGYDPDGNAIDPEKVHGNS